MRSSSLFIAIALSASGLACASSSVQTETTRLSRVSAGEGLGGLWVASQDAQPEGDIRVAHQNDEAVSDLWIKTGSELKTEDMPRQETPRLDWALSRMTPASASTFVAASQPTKARQ